MIRLVTSWSAAARLSAARGFTLDLPAASELLIVSASRGAADDFARDVARTRGATFGLYRFSLTQLAARLAAPRLATARLSPTTALGVQAVAARALFDATSGGSLSYFAPVAATPGFPRALARTLEELALALVAPSALRTVADVGADLADLYERFDAQFQIASAVDRAAFLRAAADAAADRGRGAHPYAPCRLVFLDVAVSNAVERTLVGALAARAPDTLITVPDGDVPTLDALRTLAAPVSLDGDDAAGLDRLRRHLFAATAPPAGDPLEEVELFSAPGEGRESVEIARRVLREARRGVPFDRMAIALRAPQQYAGLLEHALERAGIPVYFDRGTRRPHPAGRAFLALLACAARQSVGAPVRRIPVARPGPGADRRRRAVPFPTSSDEVFGCLGDRAEAAAQADDAAADADGAADAPGRRAFRAPWKWERLLAESRVVGRRGSLGAPPEGPRARVRAAAARAGAHRCRSRPRIDMLAQKIADLDQLAGVRAAADAHAGRLAARRPRGPSGSIGSTRSRRACSRGPTACCACSPTSGRWARSARWRSTKPRACSPMRLATLEAEPPARRYGRRVRRAARRSCAAARSTSCSSRRSPSAMFPQKPREDPLLLDAARAPLGAGLRDADATAPSSRSCSCGSRSARPRSALYVSFPTVEIGEGRPRVPSLYALEVLARDDGPRAERRRAAAGGRARSRDATLAWPAPADRREAIDALEHDLATLRALVDRAGSPRARPRALHPAVERLPAALGPRALHARRSGRGPTGTASRRSTDRAAADSRRAAARRAPLFAVGAAEVRRLPVSVPARARSTGCGRPRTSSRCSGWIR